MSKKGALFDLIKSMSRSEKRYFRLFAGKEDTVYVQLFTAIEKQDVYDEIKIKKQFKNEKFTRQLHVAKNYLAALIMRSLRNFHSHASAKAELLDLLRDAEILMVRELYGQCEFVLNKAEDICRKFEYQPLLLEVLNLKRSLALARGDRGPQMMDLLVSERDVLNKTLHLNGTWQLTTKLYTSLRDKDFLKDSIINLRQKDATLRSESLRRHLRYSWYFVNGKQKNAESEIDALLAAYEEQPGYISEEPGPYVTAIGNKISMLLNTKRWEETEALLQRMRNLPAVYKLRKNSRFTLRLWLRLFNLELEYYRDSGKTEQSLKLVKEISVFLAEHQSAVPANYVLLFRFQFALVHYNAGDLRSCLREINEIINGNFDDERADLQCSARLLNLVVHFELGNILVLRYVVDSTQRFLTKHKQLREPEKVLLTLFKKLSRAEKSEYKKLFVSAAKHYVQNNQMDYFDFGKWIGGRT